MAPENLGPDGPVSGLAVPQHQANLFRQQSYERIAPNQEANRAAAKQGIAEATARFEAAKKTRSA